MTIVLVGVLILVIGCATEEDLIMVQRNLSGKIVQLQERVDRLEDQDVAGQDDLKKEVEGLRNRQIEMYNTMEEVRTNTLDSTGKLESEVLRLKRQLATGKKTSDSAEMETSIRELKSNLEEIQANAKEIQAVDRDLKGMEQRLARVEQFLGMTKAVQAPAPAAAKTTPEKSGPDKLYSTALNLYKKGQYDSAQNLFVRFVSMYPKDKNADNSQFWIGECLFKKKEYGKAILEYQKVVENYSKGNKVPDALLKQGMAFKHLGDKTSAKILFQKVRDKYPNSSQSKIAVKELDKL